MPQLQILDKALLIVQGIYNNISGYICSYEVFYLLKNICVSLPVELVANLWDVEVIDCLVTTSLLVWKPQEDNIYYLSSTSTRKCKNVEGSQTENVLYLIPSHNVIWIFFQSAKAGVEVGLHKTGCGLARLFAPVVCSLLYQVVFFQCFYRQIKGDFMENSAVGQPWPLDWSNGYCAIESPRASSRGGSLWAVPPPGLIYMAAHGDLLCVLPMGCRGDSLHTMGHSWAAGSFCSTPGALPVLQHLPWWLQCCLSHIFSFLSPSSCAMFFTLS